MSCTTIIAVSKIFPAYFIFIMFLVDCFWIKVRVSMISAFRVLTCPCYCSQLGLLFVCALSVVFNRQAKWVLFRSLCTLILHYCRLLISLLSFHISFFLCWSFSLQHSTELAMVLYSISCPDGSCSMTLRYIIIESIDSQK